MLKISEISFPGFGIEPFSLDSVAFSIGKFNVAWYGIILTLGIIFAVCYLIYRREYAGLTVDDIVDFALFTVPAGILGGRIYYVLTSLDKYDSFYEAIAIWHGGLAIYGALIGGAAAVLIVSRVKKKNFLAIADALCPGIMMAQAIGRWGNFFNAEAHGYETTLPWRMGIEKYYGSIYVHPTFLYECLWNLLGFILINIFFKHKRYNGQVFYMCFGWYGFGRMFIEALRSDSLYIFGSIRISQLVGFLCFTVFTALLVYNFIKYKKQGTDAALAVQALAENADNAAAEAVESSEASDKVDSEIEAPITDEPEKADENQEIKIKSEEENEHNT